MGTPAFHTFERKVVPSDKGTERKYCLIAPHEARWLLTLISPATPAATTEVDKAALTARVTRTAEGKDPLQSGEQAFYA